MRKLILLLAFLIVPLAFAQTGDGIPDNCESAATAEVRANFPRYEFHNSRLVLVNWNTGADFLVLEGNLVAEGVYVRDWISDCRYLIGTVQVNYMSDFVVWDAVNGGRVLTINSERHFHYAYHVYEGSRLIVETPSGAWLVNLATGSQVLMAASWDELNNRNFSGSPDLNDEQSWVEARLTTGELVGYEQATGNRIENYLALRAERYPETVSTNCYGYNGYKVRYEENQVRYYQGELMLRVLREQASPDFQWKGFSSDCRYFAAALQYEDETGYDTFVWDLQANRELVFPDAQHISHPFAFVAANRALIETRHGGYLWKLDTDERILLTDAVLIDESSYTTEFDNFLDTEVLNGILWTITVDQQHLVKAYDLNTGAVLGTYDYGGTEKADFEFLDNGWLLVHNAYNYRTRASMQIGLWNTSTGEHHYLLTHRRDLNYWSLKIMSDDQRYFLIAFENNRNRNNTFMLWDLQAMNADGSANHITELEYLSTSDWTGRRSFSNGILTIGERSYDVFTGEMIYVEDNVAGRPANASQVPAAVHCERNDRIAVRYNNQGYVMNNTTGERLAELGEVSRSVRLSFSPNGCYILGSYGRSLLSAIWNAESYEPIDIPIDYAYLYSISPEGHRLLIGDYSTLYIWHIPSNTLTELVADVEDYYYYRTNVIWDDARGQILVGVTEYGVRAFDLQTGYVRAFYEGNSTNNSRNEYGYFYLSNGRYLVISGIVVSVIYDLDTGNNTAVPVSAGYGGDGGFMLSPSGRYLVSLRYPMRVWDMQNQPESIVDRQPNWTHEISMNAVSVYFIDETTIEAVDSQGNITRWSIITGEQLQ